MAGDDLWVIRDADGAAVELFFRARGQQGRAFNVFASRSDAEAAAHLLGLSGLIQSGVRVGLASPAEIRRT